MKNVAILQARITSTRLPGKVLFKCGDRTILDWVVGSISQIGKIDEICVAIPTGDLHEPVVEESLRLGCNVYRGDETDVLSRFYGAARYRSASNIMRVTTDCPYTDPNVNAELLQLHIETSSDYTCNNEPFTYPHGIDVECFTMELLEKANTLAMSSYDREHVTPWMKKHKCIKKSYLKCPLSNVSDLRLTIDYEQDFSLLLAIFDLIGVEINNYESIIRLLIERPELKNIISDIPRRI